tara:strand:- start:2549 stop:3556 length:1008 start_codon:yes stop_codon:yes gene_type:complete
MNKIFDCFLYDGEKDLLKLRLIYNLDFVYKFILVQSEVSFQGEFSIDNLITYDEIISWDKKLIEKLELITLKSSDFINAKYPYQREVISRSAFSLCYKYANENDFILLSDVDEIIDIKKLLAKNLSNKYIYNLGIYFSYFSCNYICINSPWWLAPMAIPYYLIKKFSLDISTLRVAGDSISSIPKNIRKKSLFYIGIHLSFLGGYDAALRKLKRYSDEPIKKEQFTKSYYFKSIKLGSDIFNRNLRWSKVNIKNLLLDKNLIIKIRKEPFFNKDFSFEDDKNMNLFNMYFKVLTFSNNFIFRKLIFIIFNCFFTLKKNKMFNRIFDKLSLLKLFR